jgi:hypothetical protein
MWLLFADGVAYLVYGFASGHFRRDLKPPPYATDDAFGSNCEILRLSIAFPGYPRERTFGPLSA